VGSVTPVASEKCEMRSANCKSPICILHFAFCNLPSSPLTPSPRHPLTLFLLAVVLALSAAGCASNKMATLRPAPRSPLAESLNLSAKGGPKPSERTCQFLRVYDLTDDLSGDPQQLLQKVQAIVEQDPTPESVYAVAELNYLEGRRVEASDPATALSFYSASVLHAYEYLFGERFRDQRNPYDPHFRGACDLYNGSMEAALRLLCKQKALVPDSTYTIRTAGGNWDITCRVRGGNWRREDFEKFEFVSDYEIKGLNNHYLGYGLGVPMIAVRKDTRGTTPDAKYYPPDLSFPVTAFLRPDPSMEAAMVEAGPDRGGPPGSAPRPVVRRQAVLELYDPLAVSDINVAGTRVSLESDLSTPLAYFLSQINLDTLAYAGLLRPDLLLSQVPNASRPIMGLYMVQPYQPGKIPVILVHGLWSSPMTWMQMFNDLRACPDIRDNYQFWFYLYPTAQPFWTSAARFREDLAEMRQSLDPEHREPALDQMVLVGHSMGGLLSQMQTLDSRDDFWKAVSPQPLDQLKVPADVRENLQSTFYFRPNPSVRRVITIATPHHGSSFSNETTQWLAAKMIRLPALLLQGQQALFRDNAGFFPPNSLARIETSIDSLSPGSPVFPIMSESQHAPWVTYHNIIGVTPYHGLLGKLTANSDGVVAVDSARTSDAVSELVVTADHSGVNAHPLAILEVRRILLENLAQLRGQSPAPLPPPSVAQGPSTTLPPH
jgi:pimeloyl-ACP methyl ester carboxylesterase